MTIIELIQTTKISDVINQIKIHYGNKDLIHYKNLYKELQLLIPNKNIDKTTIYINVFIENDDEAIITEFFDENDPVFIFDVSAINCNDDTVYSISAAKYVDFLSYYIEEKTLNNFSSAAILAHCLHEITFYFFNDNL